jgi:hypothetical protein
MKNYGKFVGGLVLVWFLLALSASAAHLFRNDADRIGGAVGLAAMAPVVLFSLWFAASESFRGFVLGLNPRVLTGVQVWRLVGFTFLLLEARALLPGIFAFSAGYGDMFIGATAAFVAWKLADPAHRGLFILWQVLGITDLVLAVALGTTAPLIQPAGPTMVPMTVLPLSLIPTFLVPLFLILHLICIAQARAWKVSADRGQGSLTPAQRAAI